MTRHDMGAAYYNDNEPYGNAIVPQAAAELIGAFMELRP